MISSADLQEKNPLGIVLPEQISTRLTHLTQRYFPAKWAKDRD